MFANLLLFVLFAIARFLLRIVISILVVFFLRVFVFVVERNNNFLIRQKKKKTKTKTKQIRRYVFVFNICRRGGILLSLDFDFERFDVVSNIAPRYTTLLDEHTPVL